MPCEERDLRRRTVTTPSAQQLCHARAVFVISWLALIVTGTLYPGLYGSMAMYERYNARAAGFLLGYSEMFPPFDFDTGTGDINAYPDAVDPSGHAGFSAALGRAQRAESDSSLPCAGHLLHRAAAVAAIGWFAVLFTGTWPTDMRDFLVCVSNYYLRVWTYVTMVENDYPKFGLPPS